MSRENVEIVRRFLDAQRRDDVPAALACLDPNVEFIALRAKTEGVYRGHAGIENFRADTLDSFEKFEPHFALRDLGQRVLAWARSMCKADAAGLRSTSRAEASSTSGAARSPAGRTSAPRREPSKPWDCPSRRCRRRTLRSREACTRRSVAEI